MNREAAIRQAYFETLDGNITHNGVPVYVYDAKEERNDLIYVILGNQLTQPINQNYSEYYYTSSITLLIVAKYDNSVTKDDVDDVADQIEAKVLGLTPTSDVLVQISGWDIQSIQLNAATYQSDEYFRSDNTSTINKILTFSQLVSKS